MLCRLLSYYIMVCRMVFYHVKAYHSMSYHITSHYVTCHIMEGAPAPDGPGPHPAAVLRRPPRGPAQGPARRGLLLASSLLLAVVNISIIVVMISFDLSYYHYYYYLYYYYYVILIIMITLVPTAGCSQCHTPCLTHACSKATNSLASKLW